jgi:uncharacterized protein (TIGR00297 family)
MTNQLAQRRWPLALALAALLPPALVSFVALQRKSLTTDGALAATLTGSVVGLSGGWHWSATLLTFFATSSALSKVNQQRKAGLKALWSKDDCRDSGQVLANGGMALLAALWNLWRPGPLPAAAFAGALATAAADTWATELGVLHHGKPRLITTWRPVAPGTSGAISGRGTLAAVLGSACVASTLLLPSGKAGQPRPLGIAVAGLTGSLVDSVLGATLQAAYICPRCHTPTERTVHTCGTATELVRGMPWVTNDVVNALATSAGAAVAVVMQGRVRRTPTPGGVCGNAVRRGARGGVR